MKRTALNFELAWAWYGGLGTIQLSRMYKIRAFTDYATAARGSPVTEANLLYVSIRESLRLAFPLDNQGIVLQPIA